MKKFLSFLIATVLFAASLPLTVNAYSGSVGTKTISDGVVLDTDGSDGYSGDYVVIYNPNTTGSGSLSTGNMSGLIETEIDSYSVMPNGNGEVREYDYRDYMLDVDAYFAEEALRLGLSEKPADDRESAQVLSFNVGDTHEFHINSFSPLPETTIEFKVLAKGEHCYIWTPTSTDENVWPLDTINPDYAGIAAAEFDSKFDLMQYSFGNHSNGSQGDGRLHILYYNIDDGWQPGQGFVGGYFSSSNYFYNGLPCLNLDTYPLVHQVSSDGTFSDDITRTYNVMVHEYQHMIQFSQCGQTPTWINECMSAAAEEICYPGSSLSSRIPRWLNYTFSYDELFDPPEEFLYMADMSVHNGYSMYSWNSSLQSDNMLLMYSRVSLFAQYIYTQYGNATFRELMQQMAQGHDFFDSFELVTGQTASGFVGDFRVALVANTTPDVLGGRYGFIMQPGYDPSKYYGVENLFNWLGPVVFTGSQCALESGASITIKPVGGEYYPPADAANGLVYYGVTRGVTMPDPTPITGISLSPDALTIYSGQTAEIDAIVEPFDADSYEITWTSSNPSVAAVTSYDDYAVVTGGNAGTAVITADAHDLVNDVHYTSTSSVSVLRLPTLNEALNIENGTLEFTSSGSYPFAVEVSEADRISAVSTNVGTANSSSTVSITVNVNAGDVLSFDWKVSSEQNGDFLKFSINGSEQSRISGSRGWTTYSHTFDAPGAYTLLWEYAKNSTGSSGSDCGWVDNVNVPNRPADELIIPGDTNMDGVVTLADATLTLRAALMLITLSDDQILRADVDGNGFISVTDALMILHVAMELV